MSSKKLLLIFLLLHAANLLANQDSTLQISTAGIGDAKFGMTPGAVERALGRKLLFAKESSDPRNRNAPCKAATVAGAPGVDLIFTKGQFDGLSTDKATVTTKSGFKVGDSEASIIKKFQADPTYYRYESRYGGAELMQISLGKSAANGTELRFSSSHGKVVEIKAGHAEYVNNDDDYCAY